MSNQLKYEEYISKTTKKYLQDALQECQKCWDMNLKDKCSFNCDKDYILYQSGKRALKQKLQNCLTSAEINKKLIENCYGSAYKDTISLENFIQRVKKSEEIVSS